MAHIPKTVDLLGAYPQETQDQAHALRESGELATILLKRYPDQHTITDNAALYRYVMDLKRSYMKQSPPLSKIRYNDKLSTLKQALGTHTYVTRIQGRKLKTKNELRVSSLFKVLPPEFLRMIAVHELAHLRHKDHDKGFYQLCNYMEPDYHRYEFDLRLWLFSEQHAPVRPTQ